MSHALVDTAKTKDREVLGVVVGLNDGTDGSNGIHILVLRADGMQVAHVIRSCVVNRDGESDLPASTQVVSEVRFFHDLEVFKAERAVFASI